MNTLKIRFAGLSVICLVALFSQNSIAQQLESKIFVNPDPRQEIFGCTQPMAIDGAGNKWMLYHGGGMAKFDGQNWSNIDSTDGLMRGQLNGVISDRNGDIWVSGDRGIAKYSNGSWQTFAIQDELKGIRIYGALAADSNDNIWVAALSRIQSGSIGSITLDSAVPEVQRFDGTNWSHFPIHVFYPPGWTGITSISVSPNGNILAVGEQPVDSNGKFTAGLWRLDGQSWTAFNADDGTGSSHWLRPISIHADRDGGAWVTFDATEDVQTGILYPAAINYFDGSVWSPSALTGSRFSDVWLSRAGDKYFKSNGLVVADNQGGLDSIAESPASGSSINPGDTIKNYPGGLQFPPDGTIWSFEGFTMVNTLQFGLQEYYPSSDAVANSVSDAENVATVYPNPFRISTNISYSLAEDGYVTISLFNSAGVRVASLTSENESGGEHTRSFDGSNLMDGIYRAEIQSVASDGRVTRQSMGLSLIR